MDRMGELLAEWQRDPEGFEYRAEAGAMPALDRARWATVQPALQEARQHVLEHPAVGAMKDVSLELRVKADFDDKYEAIEADPGLSALGRAERRAAVAVEQQAAVAKVLAGFDASGKKLVEAFPTPPVPAVPPGDFPRLSFSVLRAPALAPEEFVSELTSSIERKDAVLVSALLPLARSFRGRPDYVKAREQTPVAELPALEDAIARGEGMLISSDALAHHLAAAVVEKLRAQRDELVREVATHGSLRRSPRARFRDGEGRPTLARDLSPVPVS